MGHENVEYNNYLKKKKMLTTKIVKFCEILHQVIYKMSVN